MRRSSSLISTSASSLTSGEASTETKLVWRRLAESNGLSRTRRWTPLSAWSSPYTFSPSTVRVALLRPASSPSCESFTSTLNCLLYTSDAADDLLCVDLGGRRIIKKKKNNKKK